MAIPTNLLRRIDVRRNLAAITTIGPEDDPAEAGLRRVDIESIWADAVDLYRTGAHPTVQLCLRRQGRVVLNRAIGHASGNGPGERDRDAQVLASPDTPFCVFSASKAWTAVIVLMLIERGVFALDTRVTDFLPEYAAHGKERTTIGHLLTHRAGIPYLPPANVDLERLNDRDFFRAALSDLKPIAPPGTRLAYHALTGGHVLSEVIQVATGRGIRETLDEEILAPLSFRWSGYGVSTSDVPAVGRCYVTGPPLPPPATARATRALSGSLQHAIDAANDPRFLTAVVPSANVVTTSFEMSRFYELLRRGGELDGVRVLKPDTIRLGLKQTAHLEADRVLAYLPVRYGLGFMLGARRLSLYGQRTEGAFGHLGLSNVIGWADPRRALSGGLITSGKPTIYPGVDRFLRLSNSIASIVPTIRREDALF